MLACQFHTFLSIEQHNGDASLENYMQMYYSPVIGYMICT